MVLSVKFFKKTALCLLIGMNMMCLAQCSMLKPQSAQERSDKINKRIQRKREKAYQKARAELLEKHYERQAEPIRQRMDYNARQAEAWRKDYLLNDKPNIFQRIWNWFKSIPAWFDKPKKGLTR